MITKADLENVAGLARLKIAVKDEKDYLAKLSQILDYMRDLAKVDTKKVREPVDIFKRNSVARADKIFKSAISQKELLQNAPAVEGGQIKVKKVL